MKCRRSRKHARSISNLVVMAWLLSLAACATLEQARRAENFHQTAQSYHNALRRGDYHTAFGHCTAALLGTSEPDFKALELVRVTAYELQPGIDRSAPDQVRQRVTIKYYATNRMVEKTLDDLQLWQWDAKRRQWFLSSGLPRFDVD
jgi:hypothetical protein